MLLSDIIKTIGLNPETMRIVRHRVSSREYIKDLIFSGDFDLYQASQQKDILRNCTHFVSCLDWSDSKAVFWGIYEVKGEKPLHKLDSKLAVVEREEEWAKIDPPYYFYDIEKLQVLDELKNRLIINWNNPRAWYQTKLNQEVFEILPPGYFGPFPGYQDVILSFDELKTIIDNPDSNPDWYTMLSKVFGIYLILDKDTGKQYVGSASGKEGLWGRWRDYVKTKDGGNHGLIKHLTEDPNRYNNFQFSIMAVLPNSALKDDVNRLETLIKRKVGSQAHGLNEN